VNFALDEPLVVFKNTSFLYQNYQPLSHNLPLVSCFNVELLGTLRTTKSQFSHQSLVYGELLHSWETPLLLILWTALYDLVLLHLSHVDFSRAISLVKPSFIHVSWYWFRTSNCLHSSRHWKMVLFRTRLSKSLCLWLRFDWQWNNAVQFWPQLCLP
jgi:hypothetical protein